MTNVVTETTKGQITEVRMFSAALSLPAEYHLWDFEIGDRELKQEHTAWIHQHLALKVQAAIRMKSLTDPFLHVHGHCSRTGPSELNENLAYNRAYNVAAELASAGLGRVVKEVKGFGFRVPFDMSGTPRGRARNRRVELKIYNGTSAFLPSRMKGHDFSIRTVEGVGIGEGLGGGKYVVEITENWSGRKRRFVFMGIGVTIGALPLSPHGPSTSTQFTTTVPMFVEEFAGSGTMLSGSAKPGAGREVMRLTFSCRNLPTQTVWGQGWGTGVSFGGDALGGQWNLVEFGSPFAED